MKLGDYEWFKANVKFKVNKKLVKFNIIHNMDNSDFMAALDSWQTRTEEFTDRSFCDYVLSKKHMVEHLAFTEFEYKELSK
jgi:hypothetical protein